MPYPYQSAILEDDSPRRIILKARQTGISNTVAIEALHRAIARPDSTELFVSRNLDAASVLVRYVQHSLNGLAEQPRLVVENQSRLGFANGSQIISLPATPSTGRSIAATDVYLDEFAFTQHDELIYESILGTIATGGRLTILSTPNGRNNLFFRLWSGLEGGAFSRHAIHWSDCPRFDAAWGDRTRAAMTKQAFAAEYDLDFIASGDAVFDPDDLKLCRDGWVPSAAGASSLVHAWDIGRRRDHTVGLTLAERPGPEGVSVWHVVDEGPAAFARFLAPYPVIQSRIEARHRAARGRTVVESNGVGDTVIENLSVVVAPFTTTRRTKTQAIQALQLLIQQGRFKHGIEHLDRELALYAWDDDDLVQDCVIAAAMAADTVAPIRRLGAAFDRANAPAPEPTPEQWLRRASINAPEFDADASGRGETGRRRPGLALGWGAR